ncbi:MAG: hypothetical protein GY751_04735 [Bacteroidetes bacterium]|nr:hypothetical protein [Bacteroidota bacterium]
MNSLNSIKARKSFASYSLILLIIFMAFSCGPSDPNTVHIDPDNKTHRDLGEVTRLKAQAGKKSIILHAGSQFGLGSHEIKVKGGDSFKSTLFLTHGASDFNLSASSSWGTYYMNSFIEQADQDWQEVNLFLQVPDSIKNGSLTFYLHYFGQDTIFADNHTITRNPSINFQEELPDYIYFPLTVALLKELNIFLEIPTAKEFREKITLPICKKVFSHYGVPFEDYLKYLENKPINRDALGNYLTNKRQHTLNLTQSPIYEGIAGYSDQIIYTSGERVKIITTVNYPYRASLFKLKPGYQEEEIEDLGMQSSGEFSFSTLDREEGFYGVRLTTRKDTFKIPLIVNDHELGEVIILAPVTTWHAYNDYDGKSFYRNKIDSLPVYHLSTNRPLVSVDFDSVWLGHDFYILQNIYRYFDEHYHVKIYPDYYLQAYPELFEPSKTIVVAQHCEYFSPEMFSQLEQLKKTRNIISMGGNQCYYKITWNADFTIIENRKDETLHHNTMMIGGLWRSNFTTESRLWGVAYTDAGYASYHPYQLEEANHWILPNLEDLEKGIVFGSKGIDGRGLSGDETDKMDSSSPAGTVLIAKGLNSDGGGGEIVLIERDNAATLSTGSIASGSGLYVDDLFTKIVANFMHKYH